MKVFLFKNVGGHPEGSTIEVGSSIGHIIIRNKWGELSPEPEPEEIPLLKPKQRKVKSKL